MKKRHEKDGVWAYADDSDAKIGPPETVLRLGLTMAKLRKLMEDLIDSGFLNAEDMMGRRREVVSLAKRHNIDPRTLIHLYQTDFYKE